MPRPHAIRKELSLQKKLDLIADAYSRPQLHHRHARGEPPEVGAQGKGIGQIVMIRSKATIHSYIYLIMGEIININIGQAAVRIGHLFWTQLRE